tara:strand:- start:4882 stop:5199 length:318 start_codon:yes stop_codon:yes gene_type:complete
MASFEQIDQCIAATDRRLISGATVADAVGRFNRSNQTEVDAGTVQSFYDEIAAGKADGLSSAWSRDRAREKLKNNELTSSSEGRQAATAKKTNAAPKAKAKSSKA